MLTGLQIRNVRDLLANGNSPAQVAEALDLSRNSLITHLLESGKRVRQVWIIEDVVPVEEELQRVAA